MYFWYVGNTLCIGTLHLLKWVDKSGCTKTYRLVDQASTKWREIGLAIGLTLNQLDAWEHQYLGDVLRCWTRVMESWLKMENSDYPATWEGLYSLLEDVELSAISEDLRQAVIAACGHEGTCYLA